MYLIVEALLECLHCSRSSQTNETTTHTTTDTTEQRGRQLGHFTRRWGKSFWSSSSSRSRRRRGTRCNLVKVGHQIIVAKDGFQDAWTSKVVEVNVKWNGTGVERGCLMQPIGQFQNGHAHFGVKVFYYSIESIEEGRGKEGE